jgi:hypothetical protein
MPNLNCSDEYQTEKDEIIDKLNRALNEYRSWVLQNPRPNICDECDCDKKSGKVIRPTNPKGCVGKMAKIKTAWMKDFKEPLENFTLSTGTTSWGNSIYQLGNSSIIPTSGLTSNRYTKWREYKECISTIKVIETVKTTYEWEKKTIYTPYPGIDNITCSRQDIVDLPKDKTVSNTIEFKGYSYIVYSYNILFEISDSGQQWINYIPNIPVTILKDRTTGGPIVGKPIEKFPAFDTILSKVNKLTTASVDIQTKYENTKCIITCKDDCGKIETREEIGGYIITTTEKTYILEDITHHGCTLECKGSKFI